MGLLPHMEKIPPQNLDMRPLYELEHEAPAFENEPYPRTGVDFAAGPQDINIAQGAGETTVDDETTIDDVIAAPDNATAAANATADATADAADADTINISAEDADATANATADATDADAADADATDISAEDADATAN